MAAEIGLAFHEFASEWHEMVHRMANLGTGLVISRQGDEDLGETVTTDDGLTLQRRAEPVNRPFQTVFGLFQIQAYVYARGPKRMIELRPVDARLQLPPGYAPYLFEEFSPCFCVEQAFNHSLDAIARVMRQTLSKETLERINQRVGWRAEQYLDELAAPPVAEEGELMILTGDGKSVSLVKPDLARVPIFDPDERRGNRRMATMKKLKGKAATEIQTVCGYFTNNAGRMKYDEYLKGGYPIATGVIEGACRHLVKDRMERSGMRWTVAGAQPMPRLTLRHASHTPESQ